MKKSNLGSCTKAWDHIEKLVIVPVCPRDLSKDSIPYTNTSSTALHVQDKMFVRAKGNTNTLPFHLWHKQSCETGNTHRHALTQWQSQMRSGYCFLHWGETQNERTKPQKNTRNILICVDQAREATKNHRGQRDSKEWLTVTFRVVFMCGWGHYPKRLGKPQHSTPGLKETERRCHHEYLGRKVLTYGEGYLRRHRSQ